jgi:hypothetical protein
VGRALLWLPYYIVNKMIDCIISAEEKLGKPPSTIEIFVEMKQRFTLPVNNIFEGAAVLTSLYREDMLYANDVCSNFSVTRHDGYLTYSERFRKLFGDGYASARDGSVVVTTAKTINFRKLNAMLKSKNESDYKE